MEPAPVIQKKAEGEWSRKHGGRLRDLCFSQQQHWGKRLEIEAQVCAQREKMLQVNGTQSGPQISCTIATLELVRDANCKSLASDVLEL